MRVFQTSLWKTWLKEAELAMSLSECGVHLQTAEGPDVGMSWVQAAFRDSAGSIPDHHNNVRSQQSKS